MSNKNKPIGSKNNYYYCCFSLKMLSVIDSRFECSICLNCLKDPMLTRCGHRFCSECIHAWLK